jgi:hypothetical protein
MIQNELTMRKKIKEKIKEKIDIRKIIKEKKGVFKMTPLDSSFESLLLRKIPALKKEELDKYANLLALSHELRMLLSAIPLRDDEGREIIENNLDRALNGSYKILNPYWKRYNTLHKKWFARKRFALYRGDLLQIVSSWDRLKNFLVNYFKYLLVFFIRNKSDFLPNGEPGGEPGRESDRAQSRGQGK